MFLKVIGVDFGPTNFEVIAAEKEESPFYENIGFDHPTNKCGPQVAQSIKATGVEAKKRKEKRTSQLFLGMHVFHIQQIFVTS